MFPYCSYYVVYLSGASVSVFSPIENGFSNGCIWCSTQVGRQSHIDETGVPHGWNGGPTHVELCT
ncbi:MAG: hypothetical protein UD960_16225, partial [Phocaeicola vulgatus]|nr:hypothetical protein [Phocaeicola vulgatus]